MTVINELLELDVKRPLEWRDGTKEIGRWLDGDGYALPYKIQAILAYERGEEMADECSQCSPPGKRGGPFRHCVTVEGKFNGGCANCKYPNKPSGCSFAGKLFTSIFHTHVLTIYQRRPRAK